MNIECLSIYLNLFKFLSQIFNVWLIFFSFWCYYKQNCFLISLTDCTLLVYKNTIDLYILSSYPVTLLSLFISNTLLFVNCFSFFFFMYKIVASGNRDTFLSSFTIWMSYISFYSLILLARPFSTMLNRSGVNTNSGLFPDLEGKAFSLSPSSMIDVSYGFFIHNLLPC